MMEIKIKLFDAKEELPKRSGEYLCFIGTYWTSLPYSTRHKRFNAYDRDASAKHAMDVLFWAELPELYKEREDEAIETETTGCRYCRGIESHGIVAVKTVIDEYLKVIPAYDTPYNYCPNCGRKIKEQTGGTERKKREE